MIAARTLATACVWRKKVIIIGQNNRQVIYRVATSNQKDTNMNAGPAIGLDHLGAGSSEPHQATAPRTRLLDPAGCLSGAVPGPRLVADLSSLFLLIPPVLGLLGLYRFPGQVQTKVQVRVVRRGATVATEPHYLRQDSCSSAQSRHARALSDQIS